MSTKSILDTVRYSGGPKLEEPVRRMYQSLFPDRVEKSHTSNTSGKVSMKQCIRCGVTEISWMGKWITRGSFTYDEICHDALFGALATAQPNTQGYLQGNQQNAHQQAGSMQGQVYQYPQYITLPTPKIIETIKAKTCECGADKTYGEGNTGHSHWCAKYVKA